MFSRYFSNTPFVLLSLMAPDPGAPAGGGGAAALPTTFPEPEGDTPESKFANLLKSAKDYFSQLSGAFKEKDDEIAAHGLTKAALKKEQDDHTATKDLLKTEQDNLTATKGALKVEQDAHVATKGRVTLIESFCKHHNLDLAGLEKFKAVKEVPGGGPQGGTAEGKALYDQWQALKKDPKDARKATAFFRKHKAELQDYADSLGD
jgi:hypothetical protein